MRRSSDQAHVVFLEEMAETHRAKMEELTETLQRRKNRKNYWKGCYWEIEDQLYDIRGKVIAALSIDYSRSDDIDVRPSPVFVPGIVVVRPSPGFMPGMEWGPTIVKDMLFHWKILTKFRKTTVQLMMLRALLPGSSDYYRVFWEGRKES